MSISHNVFALAFDYDYINNAMATIKSILQQTPSAKLYIINSDIPQEWFKGLNKLLNPIGDQIIDKKIDPNLLNDEYSSHSYISSMAYARYLIPKLILDDRVLYLDCDIILDHSVNNLFNLFLDNDEWFAAVPECNNGNEFNTGVLLFNNKQLHQRLTVVNQMLEAGKSNDLVNGDQSAFSSLFASHVYSLPANYNYEVGLDRMSAYQDMGNVIDYLNNLSDPIIYHFETDDKPWNTFSSVRMRNKWWHYYNLPWDTIINYHKSDRNKVIVSPTKKGDLLTYTYSQDLEHFEELIQKLPDWDFHVAASTYTGWNLNKLIQYPNLHVYQMVTPYMLDQLIKQSTAYLDINYGSKNVIVENYAKLGKPVYTFDDIQADLHQFKNYHVINHSNVDDLVHDIENLSTERNNHE